MKAIQHDAYGVRPVLRDLPEPVCPPGGVVVAVAATGVCRSDWHAWRGHEPVPLPHIPGHELAGRIVQVDPDVRRWRVGDRVTAPFVCGCGTCSWCRAGQAQVCPFQTQPGFTGPGSFAQRVALHAADFNLIAVPEGIDDVAAASLGCRFATAYRALTVHGRIQSGQWLAVHGCGGVGLATVMIGAALGARVIAVDLNPDALKRAHEFGAEVLIDGGDDGVGRIHALGGAHVSVDALGRRQTAVNSVCSLRRRGRHVQVGLLLGESATPPLPMDAVVAQELEIYGSHGMAAHEYPAMLGAVAGGLFDPRRLLGRIIGLEDIPQALVEMDGASNAVGLTVALIGTARR